MNKIYIVFFSLLLLLLFQIPSIKKIVINFTDNAKEKVVSVEENIKTSLSFFQKREEELKNLKLKSLKLQNRLAKYEAYYSYCKDLNNFKKINLPGLYFVQTVSYASLPDFSKIYINYPKPVNIPKGLVYNNMAAGVVVKNYGRYSLALLNSNPKTSYTVIVGDKEIPGIFYGKEDVVKYVKKYVPVKVGDVVKTSGLDGIFYKGALVGKVVKVTQKKLYQVLKLKLFYNKLTPDFFYVVEKKDIIKINKGGKDANKSD